MDKQPSAVGVCVQGSRLAIAIGGDKDDGIGDAIVVVVIWADIETLVRQRDGKIDASYARLALHKADGYSHRTAVVGGPSANGKFGCG